MVLDTMPLMRTIALLLLIIATTGCVQRTISITSRPSGALVHLNDEEVGRTPLTVPFTYYGTYDVRLSHETIQLTPEAAASLLNVDMPTLQSMITRGEVETETVNGRQMVLLDFKPTWTKAKAEAPFWEYAGPDLIAEAIPNNKVEIKWHFELQPQPVVDDAKLIDRAGQMRALSDERNAATNE